MEWLPPLVGVIVGCILTYCFTRVGASQERKSRERDQLRSALRNMLVEVEVNLKLAKQPWQGRLVPFVTDMWDVHKGEILGLPKDLQDTLYQVYVEIQMANALVQGNLHLSYGAGFFNNEYLEKCKKIGEKAEEGKKLLMKWLKHEGVQV